MSNYGFNDVTSDKVYLRKCGIQTNAKFVSLSYNATEQYEYFDIELETADGETFRERTFGPDIDKVYPKAKYSNGVKVGEETKKEAYDRVTSDINRKLFYLASCYVDPETLKKSIAKVNSFKELVEAVSKAIGKPEATLNFLVVWKNNDTKRKSNLIFVERAKWCEPYEEGKQSTLRPSAWVMANQMVEKYPYQSGGADTAIMDGQPMEQVDDLPF